MKVEDWLEIRRLRRENTPIRQIARETSLARNTVRAALNRDEPPTEGKRSSPGSAIDQHETQIRDLLASDPTITTADIGRRIGWKRSHTVLKDRVRKVRAEFDTPPPQAERTEAPVILGAELTSFVGRRAELLELRALLRTARLVTLTGSGGVGKTRLAMRAATTVSDTFVDGVWLVRLDAVGDPALVAQSVLDGLGLTDPSRSTGDPVPRLVEHLKHRKALLMLDSCEHVLDAVAPLLWELLQRAPRLTVLVTSRQPLGVAGEHVLPVQPLPVPEDDADISTASASPSVSLFAERAAATLPGFELRDDNFRLVTRACRVLEGIPLAIELATVRLQVLSLAELLDHLDQRFAVLTGGSFVSPARQRTLEATIAWSFDLCTPHERALWSRAAVFVGGFEMQAAGLVCADETLSADTILESVSGLVAKSILVREEHEGRVRFRMLDTIREFGLAQLPPDVLRALRARHLEWCQMLLAKCSACWFGADQVSWKLRMRREQANLRAALDGALDPTDGDALAALRVVGPWFLWATALSLTEHRRWLHRALDAAPDPTPERAWALATCGFVASAQGDLDTAHRAAVASLAIAHDLDLPEAVAFATHILGLASEFAGQIDDAERLLGEAAARYRQLGMPDHMLAALETHLGMFHLSCGQLDAAHTHLERVDTMGKPVGEMWARSYATDGLGYIALARGDVRGARSFALDGLRLAAAFDDTIGLAFAIELVAWTAVADGQYARAAVFLGAATSLWGSFGQQLYGSPFWQERREAWSSAARNELGVEAFEAAHRRGAGMDHADIVELAVASKAPSVSRRATRLTTREHEVAELVAQGRTNREIAERLFLSPRTVEGHVSHALEKLDLKRRSQLAVWVSNHPTPTP